NISHSLSFPNIALGNPSSLIRILILLLFGPCSSKDFVGVKEIGKSPRSDERSSSENHGGAARDTGIVRQVIRISDSDLPPQSLRLKGDSSLPHSIWLMRRFSGIPHLRRLKGDT
ncbi:unnamed protein product, partial [Linum tenue]